MENNTFRTLETLLERNRSVRRFDNSRPIDDAVLRRLVGLTRLCASGRNLQPLRYRIVTDSAECDTVFPTLAWAGYYKDWAGPAPDERPVAYLVQCLDTDLTTNPMCDEGLQLEAITLGAVAVGLNCCIIKAFNAPALSSGLGLPEKMLPCYVLALGYAAEETRIVELGEDGDYRYYRDSNDRQCVPKRPLDDLLL